MNFERVRTRTRAGVRAFPEHAGPQKGEPIAKPHSAVPNPGSSSRIWKMPIAVSKPLTVTAKQAYVPAICCRCAHAMNRSKLQPSSVVGR